MTAAPTAQEATYVRAERVGEVAALLESGFGYESDVREATLFHQGLLDVLDRGDYRRMLVWPADRPRAVCHVGTGGRLLPAGDPVAAPALAGAIGGGGWRVLIGEQPIAEAMVDVWGRGFFRRRTTVREQRYMRVLPEGIPDVPPPEGFRSARTGDLEAVTDLAARLHVEDLMRPPLSRGGRNAVRTRMKGSIDGGDTFVVQHAGRIVAKTDVSLYNSARGAQIAGVYVEGSLRGQGLATALVAAVARSLALEGVPGVTLHVRADNTPAHRAYGSAGFVDRGPLTLALR
jgi:ribosomal protein S18 acetylase RimI-like enzyme